MKPIEERNFIIIFFKVFLINNNIKHYWRNTSLGAVFAERFNLTIRNLLKRPVFEKSDGNWIDVLRTIAKQYNIRVHTSTTLRPTQPSFKKKEGFVYKNLLDKRKKIKPKYQVNDLVRTADLEKTFSKGDTTNWSYKMYKSAAIINDTIPSYKNDSVKERYNEALLKKRVINETK